MLRFIVGVLIGRWLVRRLLTPIEVRRVVHKQPCDDWVMHETSPFCVCGPTFVKKDNNDDGIDCWYIHYRLDGYDRSINV
jgi:hypothetical protein